MRRINKIHTRINRHYEIEQCHICGVWRVDIKSHVRMMHGVKNGI